MRWTAIVMAAVEVYIHALLVPSHLQEKLYIGVGFIIADVLLALVLTALLVDRIRPFGWLLGAAVCAGMFTGFVLSRTTGLPGYHETWTSDGGLALASLPPEIVFIGCALASLRVRRAPAAAPYPIEVRDAESIAQQEETETQALPDGERTSGSDAVGHPADRSPVRRGARP